MPPLTIQRVKDCAERVVPSGVESDMFILIPAIALRAIRTMKSPIGVKVERGETVYADSCYGKDGKYRNTVHLRDQGNWWDVDCFVLT